MYANEVWLCYSLGWPGCDLHSILWTAWNVVVLRWNHLSVLRVSEAWTRWTWMLLGLVQLCCVVVLPAWLLSTVWNRTLSCVFLLLSCCWYAPHGVCSLMSRSLWTLVTCCECHTCNSLDVNLLNRLLDISVTIQQTSVWPFFYSRSSLVAKMCVETHVCAIYSLKQAERLLLCKDD